MGFLLLFWMGFYLFIYLWSADNLGYVGLLIIFLLFDSSASQMAWILFLSLCLKYFIKNLRLKVYREKETNDIKDKKIISLQLMAGPCGSRMLPTWPQMVLSSA